MQAQNNNIVILGAGESGTGAALLAKKKNFEVFVSDKGQIQEKFKQILIANNIEFEENIHTEERIIKASKIIKSPGIPENANIIIKVKNLSIPVISEIEFAAGYTDATKICITGSNGKTTTTLLIYHILKQAGKKVALTGNVGKSFAAAVAEGNYDYYVIELSSFQLDNMYNFKAEIAILLNITPDHLDRYNYDFNNYIDSKFRITNNQTSKDILIYCSDDNVITSKLDQIQKPMQVKPFSAEYKPDSVAYMQEDCIIINTKNDNFKMETDKITIQGTHNMYNSMAAGIASKFIGITNPELRNSFQTFENVEHRLEKYIKVGGIQFINDSKATNVNSVWYALQTIKTKIVLIAGGIDKGNDYSILKELVDERVKAIVCLGELNANLVAAFGEKVKVIRTKSMQQAVQSAYELAEDGDTVLLSPACASFDLFDNYEHRGTEFKNAVREL